MCCAFKRVKEHLSDRDTGNDRIEGFEWIRSTFYKDGVQNVAFDL